MTKEKSYWPLIEDFIVFLTIVRKNSFSQAAKELGQSNAYITKRINILEERLRTTLFYRNTRQIKLTPQGVFVQQQATSIVGQMENLLSHIAENKKTMLGHLHICSSFGFGRTYLASPISLFANRISQPHLRINING